MSMILVYGVVLICRCFSFTTIFKEGTYMNFCMMNLKHEHFYVVELIPRDITPKGRTFVNFIIINKWLRAGPTLHGGPYTIYYRDQTGT